MVKFVFSGRVMLLAVTVCMSVLLQSCVSMGTTEETIEKRATARWAAILGDELEEAYGFLTPGYRSSVSSKQYQRALLLQKVQWTDARYIESACVETSCKLKISLDYTIYGAVPGVSSFDGTQQIEESWVKVKGKWYFVPNK
jgi:hypothetical protein